MKNISKPIPGKIKILRYLPKYKVKCECYCGKIFITSKYLILNKHTQSCGCHNIAMIVYRNYKHGGAGSRLWTIHNYMLKRCHNTKSKDYHLYGGRGIKVCSKWKDFVVFRDWALTNGYRDNLSIDRRDNDKGYSPDNCRWVNDKIQAINQRVKSTSSCGLKGLKQLDSGNWQVRIQTNGKRKSLGTYKTSEEAVSIYNKAAKKRENLYLKELNDKN